MFEESNSREVLLRKMFVASFITIHDISEELSLRQENGTTQMMPGAKHKEQYIHGQTQCT